MKPMFQRHLNAIGRYLDQVLFGEASEVPINILLAAFTVSVFFYVLWQLSR